MQRMNPGELGCTRASAWGLAIGVGLLTASASGVANAQEVLSVPSASGFGSAVAAWSQSIYVDHENPLTPPQYSTSYEYVVAGAPEATSLSGGYAQGGQAFLYSRTLGTSAWTQLPLSPAPQQLGTNYRFGASVAIKGGYVFVGAPGGNKVFAFDSTATGDFSTTNPRVLSDTDLGFSAAPPTAQPSPTTTTSPSSEVIHGPGDLTNPPLVAEPASSGVVIYLTYVGDRGNPTATAT